ncbi:MAG: amino acid--[acyl-carrier-protein] ligase [Proteobacteria bacterium]|nr:amino acid--[acyl-carrier-protein] ligase [Pseudomonadota bacterium]
MTTEFSSKILYDDLVKFGHIIPVGVPGIFGRGAVFEEILNRFDAAVSRLAASDHATKVHFPPCINRQVLQKSMYIDSFPQLSGTVFSFTGNDAAHRELSSRLKDDKPWGDLQTMTDCCLTPAACYPVYPTFTGTLPPNGALVDVQNWVFRHEPSEEPTRMQAFRVHEYVRLGTTDVVVAWRDLWLQRGLKILLSLGLPVKAELASDPFFGRGGRMLAANQREQKLKFEVVCPVISSEKPTALCSFNYHQDKFGTIFNIKTSTGETADTACLGFGLERIVMALLKTHGMDPDSWPKPVREVLWA